MNPITHQPRRRPPHCRWHLARRVPTSAIGAGVFALATAAAILVASALPAAATAAPISLRGAVGSRLADDPGTGKLQATFTTSAVSVTPNLGTVELLLTGTGTVQGYGSATEVVGVIQDFTVSPCGTGGADDTAQRRVALNGGVLVMHEIGMTCVTASGPQASGSYRIDGKASTGIFAGASGTGHVTVNITAHIETLSGTLILAQPGD